MRLVNPYTGCAVDAQGTAIERLKAMGYKPEKAPSKRKPAPKKPNTTE